MGNDSADSAPRVRDITQISWNQMDVAMKNRLSCTFANVDTDVEAVWMELLLHDITALHLKFSDLCMFFWLKIEETCHMAFGDNKRMSGRDRKVIVESQSQTFFRYDIDVLKIAEWTRRTISLLPVLFQYMIENVTQLHTSIGSLAEHEQIRVQLSMDAFVAELPQCWRGIGRRIIWKKLPEAILTQMVEWISHIAMVSADDT